jgi:hypothetical protein
VQVRFCTSCVRFTFKYDRAMSAVTLANNWSYDRMMRLFGGMWFMLLALCVASKIGTSLSALQ